MIYFIRLELRLEPLRKWLQEINNNNIRYWFCPKYNLSRWCKITYCFNEVGEVRASPTFPHQRNYTTGWLSKWIKYTGQKSLKHYHINLSNLCQQQFMKRDIGISDQQNINLHNITCRSKRAHGLNSNCSFAVLNMLYHIIFYSFS